MAKSTLSTKLLLLKQDVDNFKKMIDLRLTPIERLVYGFTGLILVSVIGGIIALVIKK